MKKVKSEFVSKIVTGVTKEYFDYVFTRMYNNQDALLAFKLYVL